MHPITQWIQQTTQLPQFDVLTICHQELPHGSWLQVKTNTHKFVDTLTKHKHHVRSRPHVIIMLEVLSDFMLVELHRVFFKNFQQLDNLHLICVGHMGLVDFYDHGDWRNGEKITIYEVPDFPFSNEEIIDFYHCGDVQVHEQHTGYWGRAIWYQDIDLLSSDDIIQRRRGLDRHFVLNSGRTSHHYDERYRKIVLWLALRQWQHTAVVDYQPKCESLETLLELFADAQLSKHQVEFYLQQYCTWVDMNTYQAIDQLPYNAQPLRDWWPQERDIWLQCFANVARESHIDQGFNIISEKTMRAFRLHQMVIPTGYQALTQLEDLGFKFDKDFFDYSYQNEYDVMQLVWQLKNSMDKWISRNDIESLRDYYSKNIKLFLHNADLAMDLTRRKSPVPN